MKYIEMFGLPGAGKTTISVPVVNKLKEEGYLVAGLSDVYFRNCNNRNKIKVWMEMVFSLDYFPLYYSILRYGLSLSRTKESIIYLFKLLFFVYQLIKTKEEGKYNLVLCEEGIVQHLTSLSYLQELPDTQLLKNCLSKVNKYVDVIAIDCRISIEESLSRINMRNEGISRRFSSERSSELLLTALKAKQRSLSIVSQYVPTIHQLTMKNSVAENINKLYSLTHKAMN